MADEVLKVLLLELGILLGNDDCEYSKICSECDLRRNWVSFGSDSSS